MYFFLDALHANKFSQILSVGLTGRANPTLAPINSCRSHCWAPVAFVTAQGWIVNQRLSLNAYYQARYFQKAAHKPSHSVLPTRRHSNDPMKREPCDLGKPNVTLPINHIVGLECVRSLQIRGYITILLPPVRLCLLLCPCYIPLAYIWLKIHCTLKFWDFVRRNALTFYHLIYYNDLSRGRRLHWRMFCKPDTDTHSVGQRILVT